MFFTINFEVHGQLYVDTYAGTGIQGFVNGDTSVAQLYWPYGVATDNNNNVYVADAFNHCIRKVSPNGQVTTVAGNGTPGFTNGNGTSATFNTPTGIFVAPNGKIYVADNLNNAIRVIDQLGNVTTVAGSGAQGYSDGPANSAEFYEPKSLTVDANGIVYVADYENHTVRKIQGGMVSTLAGNGVAGFVNGTGTAARLNRPRDIVIDVNGNLFVTDLMNHSIRKITPSGVVTTFVGNGIAGNTNGSGTSAQLSTPTGITIDNLGNFYVSDAVTPKIRKITSSGQVSTYAGSGNYGYFDGPSSSAKLTLLQDVAINSQGEILIGDRDNNRVRIIKQQNTNSVLTINNTNIISNVNCFGGNNGSASVNISGGTAPYSYLWMPSGQNTAIVNGLTAGTYTVTITDANSTVVTTNVTITQAQQLNAQITGDSLVCGNGIAHLIASVTGGTPNYIYNWNNNQYNTQNISPNISQATAINLIVSDSKGCSDTVIKTINQINSSTANFNFESVNCSNTYKFVNLSTNSIYNFWNFGDGYISNVTEPNHAFASNGTYNISLITNQGTQCADTLIKQVQILNSVLNESAIPNVFTPNNDDINDIYELKLPHCDVYTLSIYDRWGLLIFYTDDAAHVFWKGKDTSGDKVVDGLYFYVLENKSGLKLKGNITVFQK